MPLETFSIQLISILNSDLRLDARYYSSDVYKASTILNSCGYRLKPLSEVVESVFHLPRFDRTFTDEEDKGFPYLSPTDLVMFKPLRKRFILKDIKRPERFFVKEGWLLLTCSGAIGRAIYVTKSLEKYFITHDIIRIVPKSKGEVLSGFLYAYLWSWIGNALLTKDQYGMTVKHIEPEHVRQLLVPILPKNIQRKIHEKIIKAWQLREEANRLEEQAINELLKFLKKSRNHA